MNTQKGTSFKVGNQYEFEALYKGFDEKLPFGFEVIKRTPKTVTVRYDSKNQAEQTFRIRLSGDHELININHIAGGELHTHKTLFAKNTTNQERGNKMENNYLKFVDGRWEKEGKKMAQNDEEKEAEAIRRDMDWKEFAELQEVQVDQSPSGEGNALFYNDENIVVSVEVNSDHDDTTLWEDKELIQELQELVKAGYDDMYSSVRPLSKSRKEVS